MTLHVHIAGPSADVPSGMRVVGSVGDLVVQNDALVNAQARPSPDTHVWLTDERLITYIPQPQGGFVEIHRPRDPLRTLEATYGPLPANLSPEMAERWLEPPFPEGTPILQLLLARVLEIPELEMPGSTVNLTQVVESVACREDAFREPLLREAWLGFGPKEAIGTASRPGPLRDPAIAPLVLAMRLLGNYPPPDRSRVLDASNWCYPESGGVEILARTIDMPDPGNLRAERLAGLNALLRPVLEQLPLAGYLATVSGRLGVELQVLLERLECAGHVEELPLEAIRLQFSWLLETDPVSASRFEQFAEAHGLAFGLATPEVSAETVEQAQAGLQAWKGFFTHSYLPALAVWRRLGRRPYSPLSKALFGADEAFALWVAAAYPKLKALPAPPLAYREIRRRSRSSPCIVLLVDGLAYELVDILREEAYALGASFSSVDPWLASLPTVTDVGMLTAVGGLPVDAAWSDEVCSTESARQRREELLQQRVPGAVVHAIYQIDQIEKALQTPSDLYVLVWSDVDTAAHRYADADLFTDHARVSLRHVLRAIARTVDSLPHLRTAKDTLTFIVGADHGWTDLLMPDPVPRPVIEGAKPHHRLYELPRLLNAEELEGLTDDWIVLEGASYDLPGDRTYLIPRKNLLVTRGRSRQHGGLSQGEVLVPVAVGHFVRRAYRRPAVALIGPLPLQKEQEGEIRVVLSNPNEGHLQGVRLASRDLDLRAEIGRVAAGTSETFGPFPVRPRRAGIVAALDMTATYEGSTIGPEPLQLEAKLHVERTPEERMAADYSSLDRLFDEHD